ncbi:MAG: polysaccharide deacetylase family protein, partial [Candidatus Omnitrophica bacterium]|nr:polysaccharide deacetylase family protein [Candidatus Omnitrophota bacterium]
MRLRIAVFFLVCLYFPTFGRAEEMKLPEVESMGRGVTLLWEGPSDRQVVALTFDDGPIPGKTEPILDLLGENQVPATFFVLGENAERHPEILKRMVREGHEIGNHTVHHPDLTKLSTAKVREEIKGCQKIVEDAVGCKPRFFRPPYGAANLTTMSILSSQNLSAVFWSIDPQDWRGGSEQEIVSDIDSHLDNGAIILLHERSPNTGESIPTLIQTVREKGFRFVTMSEMFGYPPFSPTVSETEPATQFAKADPQTSNPVEVVAAQEVPTPQVVMIGGSLSPSQSPPSDVRPEARPINPVIEPASPRPIGSAPMQVELRGTAPSSQPKPAVIDPPPAVTKPTHAATPTKPPAPPTATHTSTPTPTPTPT